MKTGRITKHFLSLFVTTTTDFSIFRRQSTTYSTSQSTRVKFTEEWGVLVQII